MLKDHEEAAVRQAAISVTKVTGAYSEFLEQAITAGRLSMEEAQDGIRTLNHAACAMERLYRVLNGSEPGTES